MKDLIEHVRSDGPRRYARWKVGVFDDLVDAAASVLSEKIAAQPNAREVFAGYLRFAEEAIGLGYIDRQSVERVWPTHTTHSDTAIIRHPDNLFAIWILALVPQTLHLVPADEQLALLVRLWNLSEGLLSEAPWLNRYVAATASRIADLSTIEEAIADILEPALETRDEGRFKEPYAVSHLDTRGIAELFLPGEMHFVAPAVLCIHDRRYANTHLGVFLKKSEESRLTDVVPCLGDGRAAKSLEEVEGVSFGDSSIRIRGEEVKLPFLRVPHRFAATPSGFVVVSAVDSQLLWIVESA